MSIPTFVNIDQMGIDKVGNDEVGRYLLSIRKEPVLSVFLTLMLRASCLTLEIDITHVKAPVRFSLQHSKIYI